VELLNYLLLPAEYYSIYAESYYVVKLLNPEKCSSKIGEEGNLVEQGKIYRDKSEGAGAPLAQIAGCKDNLKYLMFRL